MSNDEVGSGSAQSGQSNDALTDMRRRHFLGIIGGVAAGAFGGMHAALGRAFMPDPPTAPH